MITRTTYPFTLVQNIFSGIGSEALGGELQKIQEGEREFGQLSGLAPLFDSMRGLFKKRVAQQTLHEMEPSETDQSLLRLFGWCFWECAYSQYPAATDSASVEMRHNWILVECVGSYNVPISQLPHPLMDEFFHKLTAILRGEIMFSDNTVLKDEEYTGRLIAGNVTHPIVQQICILHRKIEEEYTSHLFQSEDDIDRRFHGLKHEQFVHYTFKVDRMRLQYNIINWMMVAALNFQGFNQSRYFTLLDEGTNPYLRVRPNWDIIILPDNYD